METLAFEHALHDISPDSDQRIIDSQPLEIQKVELERATAPEVVDAMGSIALTAAFDQLTAQLNEGDNDLSVARISADQAPETSPGDELDVINDELVMSPDGRQQEAAQQDIERVAKAVEKLAAMAQYKYVENIGDGVISGTPMGVLGGAPSEQFMHLN